MALLNGLWSSLSSAANPAQAAVIAQQAALGRQYVTVTSTGYGSYLQPIPQGSPGLMPTQYQGGALLPANPVSGDSVSLWFNGQSWENLHSAQPSMPQARHDDPPPSVNGYTLDQLHQAAEEIENANNL